MKFSAAFTKPQLRIVSSIFSNLGAGWILAMFLAQDAFTLTGDIIFATISISIGLMAEEVLEKSGH